jgi:hypothetical protein
MTAPIRLLALTTRFAGQEVVSDFIRKRAIWPLSPSSMGEALRQGFILGSAGTRLTEIPNAVRKLRNVLAMK